jgi:hypothetical protein
MDEHVRPRMGVLASLVHARAAARREALKRPGQPERKPPSTAAPVALVLWSSLKQRTAGLGNVDVSDAVKAEFDSALILVTYHTVTSRRRCCARCGPALKRGGVLVVSEPAGSKRQGP